MHLNLNLFEQFPQSRIFSTQDPQVVESLEGSDIEAPDIVRWLAGPYNNSEDFLDVLFGHQAYFDTIDTTHSK